MMTREIRNQVPSGFGAGGMVLHSYASPNIRMAKCNVGAGMRLMSFAPPMSCLFAASPAASTIESTQCDRFEGATLYDDPDRPDSSATEETR
jgi:hypothetical protein